MQELSQECPTYATNPQKKQDIYDRYKEYLSAVSIVLFKSSQSYHSLTLNNFKISTNQFAQYLHIFQCISICKLIYPKQERD